MAPPSKYTLEFREEAVQIALRSSKTISETARELEINPETLRGWVKKHQKRTEPPADAELSVSERARLKELERRIREVEMENVFLKNALRTSRRIPGSEQVRVHRDDAARHRGVRVSRRVYV
ncbi:transposase [Streptomyces sp. NBC_01619]|uniref:transposase n=1 Tax=Streptomyces sp. NBC_01619 TaxID=2975901 RepID=UPI00224F549D|nr:transposase [Streptomyces sp. NBC_01619]MCX4516012.1 transposase [Streptomyces sp. NBC_01619]